MKNSENITRMINEVYDGVAKSCVGSPLIKNEKGETVCVNLAMHTFLCILGNVCPKGPMQMNTMSIEPKEPWQQDGDEDE